MWIVVEWTNDKRECFPSYGIVKMKYVLDKENVQYGKFIRVRDKRKKKKRRARVLMVTDRKGLAKEQKKVLLKRDAKVKAILMKCVRKCRMHSEKKKAKKPEPELVDCLPGPSRTCMLRSPRIPNIPTSPSSSSSNPPSPIHETSTSSPSSTAQFRPRLLAELKREIEELMSRSRVDRFRSRSPHSSRKSSLSSRSRDQSSSRHRKRRSRSMVCSTPLPSGSNKPPKIVYDMTTQTDPEPLTQLHKPTVAFLGQFIKELYDHFLKLVAQIEELQEKLGENESVPQNQNVSNASSSSESDVLHLPDPNGNSNQNFADILKGLNVNVQLLGVNFQEPNEDESSDENAEDSDRNAQELNENTRNSAKNAQESNETDQDSDDDTQESNENDQDPDDNDQDPDDNDQNPDDDDQIVNINNQIVDVNNQIVNVNNQIVNDFNLIVNDNNELVNVIDHIIDVNDQIAAADADMREIEENNQDPDENMQAMNEIVPNVPVVAEHPQNVDGNAQLLDENVPVPVQQVAVVPLVPIVPVIEEQRQPSPKPRKLEVRRVSAQSTVPGEPSNSAQRCIYGDEDMVAIGYNRTLIPRRLMNDVNWGSYTTATRQLLQAVFPRRVLATHSLSGKPSPAFANHPRKRQLDPRIVDDIVQTVRDRCGVEKQWVRCVVTTKCTDEARLYRNRQNQLNRVDQNQENQDPVPGPAHQEDSVDVVSSAEEE